MSFMDKMIYSAKNMANAASEKAGEVYEIGRLKLQLVSLNGDLEKAYTQLGRLEYDQKKNGNDNSLLITACVSEIDSIHEDIDSLTAEISEATGEKICPHCSESVAADAAYCPKCGARLDQEPAAGDTGSRAEDGYITVTTNEADAPVDADK
ncbi:MAG: zinc ribbon domain-containing protein [Clostridiales bacterium]|nr:zinc ribbon domain-containing protein [Clostridiales bacterium]